MDHKWTILECILYIKTVGVMCPTDISINRWNAILNQVSNNWQVISRWMSIDAPVELAQ